MVQPTKDNEINVNKFREECWFTEGANEWLKNWLLKTTTKSKRTLIFEFGSGTSTRYLSGFENTQIISIEHDVDWYFKVREMLVGKKNVTHLLMDRPYNSAIQNFPNNYFDLVIVDGRDRNLCVRSAYDKVKKGGILILDNSERYEYQPSKNLLKQWQHFVFSQPEPDKYGFTYPHWKTTIYIKPEN